MKVLVTLKEGPFETTTTATFDDIDDKSKELRIEIRKRSSFSE